MHYSLLFTLILPFATASPIPQNGGNAQSVTLAIDENRLFQTLDASSDCDAAEQPAACIDGEFAQCVAGAFTAGTQCAGELQCFSLPLVNSVGTSVTCTTPEDAAARMGFDNVAALEAAFGNAASASTDTPTGIDTETPLQSGTAGNDTALLAPEKTNALDGTALPVETAPPAETEQPKETGSVEAAPQCTGAPLAETGAPEATATETGMPMPEETVQPTGTAMPMPEETVPAAGTALPDAPHTGTALPAETAIETGAPAQTALPTETALPNETAVETGAPAQTALPTETALPNETAAPPAGTAPAGDGAGYY